QHCLELHGGNGVMLDFGVEKIYRDAAVFLHMDATVDISKMKIVKSMFPATAGKKAGPGGFSATPARALPPQPSSSQKVLAKGMDCRVKPGNDDLELALFAVRAHDGR